jgi:predicted nucleotidyltransferase
MELNKVTYDITILAKELSRDFPNVRWYLFGSLLRKEAVPSDIDLLIVYQFDHEALSLRLGLSEICARLPIDLLLLREDEELELNFVKGKSAKCIFPF